MSDWHRFRAHHHAEAALLTRRGRDIVPLIARAWRLLGNPGHRANEVNAIRNGTARTLQDILNNAVQDVILAPAAVPPPPPPPPPLPPPPAIPPPDVNAAIFNILAALEDPIEQLPPQADRAGNDAAAWIGGFNLGGRAPNQASLWLHYNAENQLDDRRVIKDCHVPANRWVDYTKWHGEVHDWDARIPLEYVLQRRLGETDGGHLFAEVQAWANQPDWQMYRLMHPFYDQGDAKGFSERCGDAGSRIPEPFLWFLLEYLTAAAMVMEHGSLADPLNGWLQIVHRDLKPDNVFLSSDSDFAYPVPKVADFEFAMETSITDKHNPHIYRHLELGHFACQAPEGAPEADDDEDLINEQILSAANVWCIGITLFALMNSGRAEDAGGDFYTEATPTWLPAAVMEYSEDLREVVKLCLEKLPENRMTIGGLEAYVKTKELSVEGDLARSIRATPLAANLPENWRYRPQADRYKLGLAWQDAEEGIGK